MASSYSVTSLIVPATSAYSLLASGDGERLEKVQGVLVRRPDPQVLWPAKGEWPQVDARYVGQKEMLWDLSRASWAQGWKVSYPEIGLTLKAWPTPFRHLGFFPEQLANWQWLEQKVKQKGGEGVRVLNLFGYTGAASIVAAKAGAQVTHVDASKPAVSAATHNAALSGVDSIRWIVEDARKFISREVRRGSEYDVVLLDPPVFGRGAKGEIWRLEEGIAPLLEGVQQLVAPRGGNVLLNTYATSTYVAGFARLAEEILGKEVAVYSLDLAEEMSGNSLQTGFSIRS